MIVAVGSFVHLKGVTIQRAINLWFGTSFYINAPLSSVEVRCSAWESSVQFRHVSVMFHDSRHIAPWYARSINQRFAVGLSINAK